MKFARVIGERVLHTVREARVLRIERDIARAQRDHCAQILTRIHRLLPPRPFEHDGKTYVFNDPDPAATLRAVATEIARLTEPPPGVVKEEAAPCSNSSHRP